MCRSEPIWEVRKHTMFRVNPPAERGDGPVKTLLFVQVDPAGHAGEGFRFPLYGGHIIVDIWGRDVFEDEHLQRHRFRYEVDPAMIEIRANSLSSRWEDWDEMLHRGTLVAFLDESNEDVSAELRATFLAKIKTNPEFGAALRWNIQARSSTELRVILQCLPRPAGILKSDARFTSDYCGAIEVSSIKLSTPFEPDRPCQGPIPVLFSRDVDKTKEELVESPQLLHPGENCPKLKDRKICLV